MLSNEDQRVRIKLNGGQQDRMLSNEDKRVRIRLNIGTQDRMLSNKDEQSTTGQNAIERRSKY